MNDKDLIHRLKESAAGFAKLPQEKAIADLLCKAATRLEELIAERD